MTIRPRAVRALKDVRTRLRDVAAATAAVANDARDNSHLALVRENEKLDDYLDGAADELSAARTVHELHQVAETTGVYRLDIVDAAARHAEMEQAALAAAEHLRHQARQLRRAEKLQERVTEHLTKVEARGEQRLNDDISATRRR